MKSFNIRPIAFLLLANILCQYGFAQEENSYYFNPRKGQKPIKMKPYIDSTQLPKKDTVYFDIEGEVAGPVDTAATDSLGHFDGEYASRIGRFHSGWGYGYWYCDPWYYDPWYYDPWYYGPGYGPGFGGPRPLRPYDSHANATYGGGALPAGAVSRGPGRTGVPASRSGRALSKPERFNDYHRSVTSTRTSAATQGYDRSSSRTSMGSSTGSASRTSAGGSSSSATGSSSRVSTAGGGYGSSSRSSSSSSSSRSSYSSSSTSRSSSSSSTSRSSSSSFSSSSSHSSSSHSSSSSSHSSSSSSSRR